MSATREEPPNIPAADGRLQKATLQAIIRGEEPAELLESLQAHVGEERARLIIDRAYEEYEALEQTGRLRELEQPSMRKRKFRMSARGYSGALMLLSALLGYLQLGADHRAPLGLLVIGFVLLAMEGMRSR